MVEKEIVKEKTERKSDIEFLKLRVEKLKKHLGKNIHDHIMKKALLKTEAKLKKLISLENKTRISN